MTKQNENQSLNEVNALSCLADVTKFSHFDYRKGKLFHMNFFGLFFAILFMVAAFGFSIALLCLDFDVRFFIIAAVMAVFGIILLFSCLRHIKVTTEGVGFFNLKYHIIPQKLFIPWDDIDTVGYYRERGSKGTEHYYISLLLKDGKKYNQLISSLDRNWKMIYNLVVTYYNHHNNANADWDAVMRKTGEREPLMKGCLSSLVFFVISFFVIFLIYQISSEKTIYDELTDAEKAKIEKTIKESTPADFVNVCFANRERNAVDVYVNDSHGVYNYADNIWIVNPKLYGNEHSVDFRRNYITVKHYKDDTIDFDTYYLYDGNDGFMASVYFYLPLLVSLLLSFALTLLYFVFRRNRR